MHFLGLQLCAQSFVVSPQHCQFSCGSWIDGDLHTCAISSRVGQILGTAFQSQLAGHFILFPRLHLPGRCTMDPSSKGECAHGMTTLSCH